ATAHRDFEIFKKAVLDFCDVQSLAEAKGLGRSMDCSFMRTVRSGTVESFCIRTQRQWENEMALLLERDSILQVDVIPRVVTFAKHTPVIQLVVNSKPSTPTSEETRGRKRKIVSEDDKERKSVSLKE
ncbi:unnamed protein product, partial [Porites evermanni]